MRLLQLKSSGEDVEKWQSFLFGQGFSEVEVTGTFDETTKNATIAFQKKNGLNSDGKVGNQTYAAALNLGLAIIEDSGDFLPKPNFPSPDGTARARMLGSFKYDRKADGKIVILDGWAEKNIVKVHIPQLKGVFNAPADCRVYFHRAGAAQLQALFAAWERAGVLKYIKSWAGTFNPRMVRGSKTNVSNHAYASAFDINAAWNGLGINPPGRSETGTVVPLVSIANAHGFFWGGHYANRKDGMHFELAALNRFPAAPKKFIADDVRLEIPEYAPSAAAAAVASSPETAPDAGALNFASAEPKAASPAVQTADQITNISSGDAAAIEQEDQPFAQYLPNITKEKVLFGGGIVGAGVANMIAWWQNLSIPAQIVLGVLFLMIVAGFIWLLVTHRREISHLIREAMGFKADKSKNSPILTNVKPTLGEQLPKPFRS